MSNLLPIEIKKDIRKEYHLRAAVVALFLLGGLLLISTAWLAPVYILSANKYDVTKGELALIESEVATLQPNDPKEIINDINSKLAILEGDMSIEYYAYDVVMDIVERKNNGVTITSIFYDKSPTETRVLLRGEALNRENLRSFVSEIEKIEVYSRVDLPISNFVKETNLDFSLTVYITHEQSEEEHDV